MSIRSLRNWLNLIFVVGAATGMLVYYLHNHDIGTYIILGSMVFKFIEVKILDNFCEDYVESKVPDFDPETIKITPDIMENLREIAECSKTMLL